MRLPLPVPALADLWRRWSPTVLLLAGAAASVAAAVLEAPLLPLLSPLLLLLVLAIPKPPPAVDVSDEAPTLTDTRRPG